MNCSLRAHFVVNELILRVFVGVTLLNLIFFLLSVLFGEHPHYVSFGGAKRLVCCMEMHISLQSVVAIDHAVCCMIQLGAAVLVYRVSHFRSDGGGPRMLLHVAPNNEVQTLSLCLQCWSQIQDDYEIDMVINNMAWSMVNAFGAILCVYQTVNHFKGDRRNKWDGMNIATKYEGALTLRCCAF